MVETLLSSATSEVVISTERPFVVIGERINPTGRRQLAAELIAGDFSRVDEEAVTQVEAGAQMLDVNAGIPTADEPALLAQIVRRVQSVTNVPLCIDSSVPLALEAGLAAYQGKALVNSVTGEEERLEGILPLVRKHGAAVIGITSDDHELAAGAEARFEVARKIVQRAADHGIRREDVLIDPLVLPAGAKPTAARETLRLISLLREELGVNTTCGASNVSFGLPSRHAINATYLAMAMAAGLPSAIANPLHRDEMQSIRAAEVVLGTDVGCRRWLACWRAQQRTSRLAPAPAAEEVGDR